MTEQIGIFPVQSPCREYVRLDERGYCRGCFRSREERFNWQTMSDAQKQEVLRLCRQRLLRKIRAKQAGAGGRTAATLTVLSQKITYTQEHFFIEEAVMVQRIAYGSPGAGIFTFCDGLLASDGLENVARASWSALLSSISI